MPTPTSPTQTGASLNIGSVTGSAGSVVAVPVTLSKAAGAAVAVSTDITYNLSQVRVVLDGGTPDCTIDPSIALGTTADKMLLLMSLPGTGGNEILRVGVIGFDNANPIPDGALFTCNFEIQAGASAGTKNLINAAIASDDDGAPLAIGAINGSIDVVTGGAAVNVGTIAGAAGSVVVVPVTLSNGAGLATASADIAYDSSQIRVVMDGSLPDCDIDPAIALGTATDKMLLLETLNTGGNSRVLRVGVIGFDNANPLPSGTLFTCRFQIDAAATAGTKGLSNTPGGSGPDGSPLSVGGASGAINVL
jgi:hypothetical protein